MAMLDEGFFVSEAFECAAVEFSLWFCLG